MNHKVKGFTLIELLVVIAIIGILSSVVLASLNSARVKGRDARRLSDVSELKTALALYYNSNQNYPTALSALVTANDMPTIPTDPQNGAQYLYSGLDDGSGNCVGYHLGATLEDGTNPALNTKANLAATGTACAGGTLFDGTAAKVYDIKG